MSMRASSLANNPLAVTRELDGRYDVVLQVRDNLDLIEQVAGVDFEAVLAELEEAQDFTGISVIQGETVAWDAVNKILTVPKGDKGDTGATGAVGPIGATGPAGARGQQGNKGDTGSVGPTGPRGFTGDKGEKGDTGEDGQDLTIVLITSSVDGTFTWQFSDGTIYTTPSLIGPKGDTGAQGVKGDQGISVHHLKGTSTTNPNGDFGTSPFKDTYTLYGDANETLNLGWFVVSNGISDGMSAALYDTNGNGIVDNSERLGGELPNHYVNTSTDQQISGVKTFQNDVIVDSISYNGFGTTSWNADESTLDVVLPGATLQVGQEILIKVRAGTNITDGKVVMATGSIGNSGRIIAGLHDGTRANAKRVIGIATQNIVSGADGLVTSYGKVRGINTTGAGVGETWVDGDLLYIKPNDVGSLTKVTPLDNEINMPVAFVVHAHANGTLFVRINGVDENQVAKSAKKLETARSISLTGDVTGTVNFDGSANASITTTIAANSVALGTDTTGNYVAGNTAGTGITVSGTAGEGWSPTIAITNVGTAGTYTKVTTNAQGQVTSGTNPTTLAGYGITDATPSSHVGSTGVSHGAATTSTNGFMSNTDKTKLDGIATGANNYTLPVASASVLGGVKAGANVTIDAGGVISSDAYTKTEVDASLALKVNNSEKGVANGVSTLDSNGKVLLAQIPDSVLGQLEYMGTWNFTTLPTATQKGQYWIASVSGNGYVVGDWAVWNGTAFDKVDNTDAVSSVAGRTGNVVLTKTDVGLSNVDNTADNSKNVLSSTKLTTPRTLTIGSLGKTFDGSANVTWSLAEIGAQASGNYQPLNADLTSIAALAGTTGILKKTAANTWALDTNTYVTSSGVTTVTGTAPIVSSGGNTPALSITAATTSAAGSMSAADKTKLDGIATGANNYTLPTATSTNIGGVKVSTTAQTVAANAVSTTASRTYAVQLDAAGNALVNIPWVDTNTVYTHPTTDGSLHVPATGTTNNGKVLMAGATAGVFTWNTLPNVSTTTAGYMLAADKVKLDGIAAGAQVNVATNLAIGTITTTAVPVTSSTGTNVDLPAATTTLAGVMSAADKVKLDGIAAGAQVNTGTVTSVTGTGTVSGLSLSGTVTSTGNITLGGTLSVIPSNFASQAAATVLAAPSGAAGVPTFRTIVSSDIPTLNQNTTGSAATLATQRTIGMTGDVTWTSAGFNGSANVTGTASLATVSDSGTGTFVKIAKNTKGLVTGTTPVVQSDITSLLGSGSITNSMLPNSAVSAGTYSKVTVDSKGIVTAGLIPTMEDMPSASFKREVVVATTANITLSGTQTIDGIAVVAGNRVLVKNQTTTSQNGIYVVSAGAWTRALDADTSDEIASAIVNTENGATNGGQSFTNTFKLTDVIGTTAMLWYRMVYENGTWGISISGTAATATTLATTRTFAATGDVTAVAQNFNGSANVALPMVLANSGVTAGTYDNVTVDIKGRVTSATNNDSANISALVI